MKNVYLDELLEISVYFQYWIQKVMAKNLGPSYGKEL
jgi:hypothetical protein